MYAILRSCGICSTYPPLTPLYPQHIVDNCPLPTKFYTPVQARPYLNRITVASRAGLSSKARWSPFIENAVAYRLSKADFPRSGVQTPEGAKVVAQGEEETAKAEKERDAPNDIDLRQIHEEGLADDD